MWRVSTFPPVLISPYNIDPPIIIATMERERERKGERGSRRSIKRCKRGDEPRRTLDPCRCEACRGEAKGKRGPPGGPVYPYYLRIILTFVSNVIYTLTIILRSIVREVIKLATIDFFPYFELSRSNEPDFPMETRSKDKFLFEIRSNRRQSFFY